MDGNIRHARSQHSDYTHIQQLVHSTINSTYSSSSPSVSMHVAQPSNIETVLEHQYRTCHTPLQIAQSNHNIVTQLEQKVLHFDSRGNQLFTLPNTTELPDHLLADNNDKILIYRHPLFPILRLLFERTEMATNSIDSTGPDTFDVEIKTFINQMMCEKKPFSTDNQDVDNLILKAIQVLKIHLLELGKVNELCKDFCSRYISCLKGKLNSDNIMKTLDISFTPPSSPNRLSSTSNTQSQTNKKEEEQIDVLSKSDNSVAHSNFENIPDKESSHLIVGSKIFNTPTLNCMMISAEETQESVNDDNNSLSKNVKIGKRGVLPKSATAVLKGWLFQHLVHPYPTEEEKKELAQQTNLSNLQINNWFINARRRILQPMLETNSTFLKTNKKTKPQRSAAHKDWTNSVGVYNAYRTEALQNTATQTSCMNLLVTPSMVTSSDTMLVDLDGQTHQVMVTQPIQFVQVTQMPIQTVPTTTYISIGQSQCTSQTPVMTTCQQKSIILPFLTDKHSPNQQGTFITSLNTPSKNLNSK